MILHVFLSLKFCEIFYCYLHLCHLISWYISGYFLQFTTFSFQICLASPPKKCIFTLLNTVLDWISLGLMALFLGLYLIFKSKKLKTSLLWKFSLGLIALSFVKLETSSRYLFLSPHTCIFLLNYITPHHNSSSLILKSSEFGWRCYIYCAVWAKYFFLHFLGLFLQIDYPGHALRPPCNIRLDQRSTLALKHPSNKLFSQRVTKLGATLGTEWSFVGGARLNMRTRLPKLFLHRRHSGVYASCKFVINFVCL